jgi:CRP-like cAMP-binding protein
MNGSPIFDFEQRADKKLQPRRGISLARLDRSLIADLQLFHGLEPSDLDSILAQARSVRYPKESVVFDQDAEASFFYLLLDGRIRVVQSDAEGNKLIARFIEPGELFGIADALGRTTYPATAVAAVDCVVLRWLNSSWAEFSERFPPFRTRTYATVASRLQQTQSRLLQLSTERVEQRVASVILRLAEQAGRKVEAGIEIDFPISRQDIAEMAGTTLHTVSRLLSMWESDGVVLKGRQKVVVKDPHRLLLIAEARTRM